MRKTDESVGITVVMAIYNPNLVWFNELLKSLAKQDFINIEWLIMDDASDEILFMEVTRLVKYYASSLSKNISYKILRNKENIGSNETYRKLMSLANGKYIAFCDQDDVWKHNKLSCLYYEIVKQNAVLAYADMTVINSEGKQISESFQKKNSIFGNISGKYETGELLIRNPIPGCSVLIKKDIIEFFNEIPNGTYWDHWLNIIASTQGDIIYIPQKLMKYRIHGTNQTGRFYNIKTKNDYYENRLKPLYRRMIELQNKEIHFQQEETIYAYIQARTDKKVGQIWKNRSCNILISYLEILLNILPNFVCNIIIKIIKKW
ncbi:glycosyltransferase [Clostridium boliviensis]|nr:glycosyltransferase [Clostridium boliviensis]